VGITKSTLDGYSVTPDNEATAAIYTYTPWASSAKNHRKIWVKYANYVDYEPLANGTGSSSSSSSTGSGSTSSSGGAGGSGGSGGAGGGGGAGGSGGGPTSPEVCYPGPNEDYSVCLDLVAKSSSWSGYDYPSHSSASYQPPQMFVDLSAADPDQKLAPNFKLDEFMQEWKGRYAMYQPHLVEKLQTIRDQTGGALNVNSGFRNVTYNDSVGGATYSRHMYGDAVDMASSVVSLSSLRTRCQNLGADYVGMYTSHVHCDWRYSNEKDPAFTGNMYFQGGDDHDALPVHTAEMVYSGNLLYADATGFEEGEPLREWVAFDENGVEMERYIGETYEPPFGAQRVIVEVGGQVTLEAQP
jgi:hypothetical protein